MTSMRPRSTALLLAAALMLLASACGGVSVTFGEDSVASGDLVIETFELDDFDSVQVSSAFDALITVGDTHFVEIVTNESLTDNLAVRVVDGELRVGLEGAGSFRAETLEATIHLPRLVALEASGASSVEIIGVFGPDQSYEASGASSVTVEGTGEMIMVEASGASDMDLNIDGVDIVEIDASGASSVELRTVDQLVGDLSGASDVTVPDSTTVNVDISGASDVNRR